MNRKGKASNGTKTLTRTGGIRIHQSRTGIAAIADVPPNQFHGAFQVGLAGRNEVYVRAGTINERFPMIRNVPISGVLEDGKNVKVPNLSIASGPNAEFKSWVVLKVKVDPDTKMLSEDPKTLQVTHVSSLKNLFENGVGLDDGQGVGYLPLALILWRNESTPHRVIQNIYFNQRHMFMPSEKSKSWHVFSPAA